MSDMSDPKRWKLIHEADGGNVRVRISPGEQFLLIQEPVTSCSQSSFRTDLRIRIERIKEKTARDADCPYPLGTI